VRVIARVVVGTDPAGVEGQARSASPLGIRVQRDEVAEITVALARLVPPDRALQRKQRLIGAEAGPP